MINNQFPPQQLPYSKKGKKWRMQCVDALDSQLHVDYNKIRSSNKHKRINAALVNGRLDMGDLKLILNPEDLKANYIPESIQHYDIIGPKIGVLMGEESKRVFDYRVKITNPNAISEVEEARKKEVFQMLQEQVQNQEQSEEDFQKNLEKIDYYFNYEYQDFRETWANCLLTHYTLEYNIPETFNQGFEDGLTVGEEIYFCDIVGGEPTVEKLNPSQVEIYMSGNSSKVEDADRVIICDYWSPGQIYDEYYDVLTEKDRQHIEHLIDNFGKGAVDSMDNIDERQGFIPTHLIDDVIPSITDSTVFFDPFGEYTESTSNQLLPTDRNGNIRVLKVFWKSRRKIKKVKFYDPETGEEDFNFLPESYIANEAVGEEEESFWINQAWEGTKIGTEVYVNVRPRIIQYNRMSNPSKCHFGIIGSIYNFYDSKPFSMVDRMKPFAYLYDVIHDRLNKAMARNWGIMSRLDLSKIPAGWNMEKWLYYAKSMGLFIENSFNEGNKGAATGKLAGALNNSSQGVINADFGNNIQQYINLLDYIKMELSDAIGISKQREGQVSNRETVGGVERATLQSSHITEWFFLKHEDVKKRVLECLLDTAKIAYKGRNKKFQYITPSYAQKIIEIDGDLFSEADYGLVVDNNNGIQELQQNLHQLAQAALQNQALSFSTVMKLYMSNSLAEKQRMVETAEQKMLEMQQQQQQEQMQAQQQAAQMQQQLEQQKMQIQDQANQRDNETKIMVAEINSQAEFTLLQLKNNLTEADLLKQESEEGLAKEKMMQDMMMLDKKIALEKEKNIAKEKQFQQNLTFLREKQSQDLNMKNKELQVKKQQKSTK